MTWRWILIVAELVVGSYLVTVRWIGLATRQPSTGLALVGIAVFVAWVFLFLGSPFLVRSERWLAILGWCIAVGALFFSGSL